jgi:hypothetical protein
MQRFIGSFINVCAQNYPFDQHLISSMMVWLEGGLVL